MAGNEYNYFQISPIDIPAETNAGPARMTRAVHMRMSNFGATAYGNATSVDYTKLTSEFADRIENERTRDFEDSAVQNENPYVAGSTVKLTRDEQSFRMGMSDARGASIDQPRSDVMDVQNVRGTMTHGYNYPSEGWRSFGGKYDFAEAYDGMVH